MQEREQPVRLDRPPSPQEIDDLIVRASAHPLGIEFLKGGLLDSVAAIFQVHAFVVDGARERLRD